MRHKSFFKRSARFVGCQKDAQTQVLCAKINKNTCGLFAV